MLTLAEKYVIAALRITRPAEPYGRGLAWIAHIREALGHVVDAETVDIVLVRLHNRGETEPGSGERVELRRADMVGGVTNLVVASELRCETETWHYAGLEAE